MTIILTILGAIVVLWLIGALLWAILTPTPRYSNYIPPWDKRYQRIPSNDQWDSEEVEASKPFVHGRRRP